MAWVANFINDRLHAQEAEQLIDETMMRLKQRTGLIEKYMPLKTYDNNEFLDYITEQLNPIASLVAPGAESPLAAHGTFRRIVGELAKVALSFGFDEVTQRQMKKAMEEATYKGIAVGNMTMTDGSIMRGSNEPLVRMIFGHVGKLVQAHVDRYSQLAWQAISTGQLSVEDARTRHRLSIDFRRAGVSYNSFPDALVQTGNTSDPTLNKWSDYENADGLTNIEEAMNDYVDINGFKPDAIVMSNRLSIHLRKQKTTKEAAKQSVSTPQIGAISKDVIKNILENRDLPELITFDEFYQDLYRGEGVTNTSDSEVQNVRFLPENKFVFLKEGMGTRAMGRPLEADSLGESNLGGSSGIVVRCKEYKDIPPYDICNSISMGLPIIHNPKLLYARVVN